MDAQVKETAQVAESAVLGEGTLVWELAQVREEARLGRECVLGRGAYVGPGVVLGDRVKLQNYALVYEPARLGDGVFVGPAAVLTNDVYPRSVDPEGRLKRGGDWEPVAVVLDEGASVGARAVCVAPVRVGRWAMVAAGAVVTRDVPDFALVVGVPARQIGWVGRAGARLEPDPKPADPTEPAGGAEAGSGWRCPVTGARYRESGGTLTETG